MTQYNPQDDNPIVESDRIMMHATNPSRSVLDPTMSRNSPSGWTWKTIFEYLGSNLWQNEPTGNAMTWLGDWKAGQYQKGNVVKDGLWTMIANKITSDPAAPTLAGSPVWATAGAVPSWTTQSPVTSLVVTGAQFTAGDTHDMILAMRVYIPAFGANIKYRVIVREVLGGDLFRDIYNQEIAPLATGWFDIVAQGVILDPAKLYQGLLLASDDSSTVDFNGSWQFNYGTANVTPGAGEIYNRTSTNSLKVHEIDGDTTSRDADLDTVVAGTQIVFANGAVFTVDAVGTTTLLVREYFGSFTGFPVADWQTVVFEVPVDAATAYVEELGYWTTNPPADNASIQGMISKGDNPFTFDDVLYGIDFLTDPVTASEDWDVVALSDDLTP